MTSNSPSSRTDRPGPAIALQGISKRYGSEVALHRLDLEIGEGEFFCLLGPSGCGKTTTLNLIGGFVAPSGGAISIRGGRVDGLPPHQRDVNTVFQSYALFPHMNVAQNVGFGLKMSRVARVDAADRVHAALQMVGLDEQGHRLPSELSGGQQQRVAVARALVNRPAVLLLDEPLGALDLKLRKRLQLELAQIHREVGTVFVYVTHDQEEALALADRIAVMRAGRVEQVGDPREIYLEPRSRFVADFIGESNFFALARLRETAVDVALPARTTGGRPIPDGPTDAVVMVRPERIVISAEGRDERSLVGEVLQSSFLGSCIRVAVRCEPHDELVLVELRGEARTTFGSIATGQRVSLSWDRDAAVVIDEDDGPPSAAAINGNGERESLWATV